ncbi:hypothetical protein ACJMK2_000146 [Sinanodonta woodiana]|uniref:C2HC/C3H-type domain-containing protein n=1 Tax=Sinanodonta woodiana TaxID=1069815 RepID=A0ABD3XRU5_SINWO
MDEYKRGPDNRKPCRVCGRKFVPESLAKHEPACKKLANPKRKVFDSSKQRADGTDLTLKQIKAAQKKKIEPPKTHWRQKHQDFIAAIRGAKGVQRAMDMGEPLPPPPPPSINPDYVQCPECGRRFNQKAAERHIAFCQEQQKRSAFKPTGDSREATKFQTRNTYQPPKPKGRGMTGTGSGNATSSPMGTNTGSGRGGPSPGTRGGAAAGSAKSTPASKTGMSRTPGGVSNGRGTPPGSGKTPATTGSTGPKGRPAGSSNLSQQQGRGSRY